MLARKADASYTFGTERMLHGKSRFKGAAPMAVPRFSFFFF